MEKNDRVLYMDVAKGIGILMVMLAHNRLELNLISRICVGCHMPLFFIVGGGCVCHHVSIENSTG